MLDLLSKENGLARRLLPGSINTVRTGNECHVVIYAESSLLVSALNKGREKCCGPTTKVIEAIYRVANELHVFPTFAVWPSTPFGPTVPNKPIPRLGRRVAQPLAPDRGLGRLGPDLR